MVGIDKYKGGKGFPESITAVLADCPVKGIDLTQVRNMIAHLPETSSFLYNGYTPQKPSYRPGSMPFLEKTAATAIRFCRDDRESVQALLAWVTANIIHPYGRSGKCPPGRAAGEEEIIRSGWGWCNEQARVFCSLAQVLGFMTRVCFLFAGEEGWGHTTTEIYFAGSWVFSDPTYGLLIIYPDGKMASARDIQQEQNNHTRQSFSDQYRFAQIRQIAQWEHGNPALDVAFQMGHLHDTRLFSFFALSNHAV